MMQIVDREGLYSALEQLADALEPFFSKRPQAAMVGIARGGAVVAHHVRDMLSLSLIHISEPTRPY